MPDSREFDVRYLSNLAIPFDAQTKELADSPRIVSGANTYITSGGKLAQAPGLNGTLFTSYPLTGRVDRLVVYETIEAQPKVYIMASVYNGASWDVKYLRLGEVSPAWTSIGAFRGINASNAAHEFVIARGICFIRGFAISGLTTVTFNGSGVSPVLTAWGNARQTAAPGYSGTFGATTSVAIFGYRYAYAYVNSTTGHVTSRTPASVSTGPFINSNPRITGVYSTDTSLTHINIYRTTDGGGTLYFLAQIANNSAGGAFTYNDNGSTLVGGDAKKDAELDVRNIAPSEVSNEPPPGKSYSTLTVNEVSTGIVYFARRIWYGLGNKLFYSGQEEITNGVPEESFPNPQGIRGGAYYILQGQVRQLKATKRALYVNTASEVMILTGQDLTNFLIDSVANDVAAPNLLNPGGSTHAITSFRDTIFFLSDDLQVYSVTGANAPALVSGPLGTQLSTAISTNAGANRVGVQFEVYSRDGNVWLIINVSDVSAPENNKQFVYDLNRNMWFTPWAKPINAMTFGRVDETDVRRYLIAATYDGTTTKLAVLDTAYLSDVGTNFTPSLTLNLTTVPSGNHINELRKWAHAPMLAYFIIERTKFGGDSDPTVAYRLDEFSGATTSATAFDPPYAVQHTSYYEKWYPIAQVTKRVQLSITGTGGQAFELQNIGFAFQSEAGA